MFTNIQKLADNSQTLKEARENVKEMSLAKEIIVFILLNIVIFAVTSMLAFIAPVVYISMGHGEDVIFTLLGLFGFIFMPIVIYFIVTKIEKRSWRSVGFTKDNVVPSILKGSAIGFLMFLAVVIIGLTLGQYKYNGFDLSSVILIIPFLLGFFVQSFAEEFQSRGWALTFISKRHSVIAGIITSSIIFALGHGLNAGIDLVSVINLFLVATFFSILFLKYDNIWVCGSAHALWNFSQGIIFGFNVSGNTGTPSLLKCSQVSLNALGGGKFGPESSLISTLVIIVAIVLVLYYKRK